MKIAKQIRTPMVAEELVSAGYVLEVVALLPSSAIVNILPGTSSGQPGTPIVVDPSSGFTSQASNKAVGWRITAKGGDQIYYQVVPAAQAGAMTIDADPRPIPDE